MLLNKNIKQKVVAITNDLEKLIPIGTLNFFNLPLDITDLQGVKPSYITPKLDNDLQQWSWLDIDYIIYLLSINHKSINPILFTLKYLLEKSYIQAIYKVVKVTRLYNRSDGTKLIDYLFSMCRIRLYSIPADVEGARHIREYRQLQSKSLKLDRQYASHFEQLLKYLDFSHSNWFIGKQLSIELLLHQGSLLLIDCQCTNELGTASNDELKFHLQRWSNKQSATKFTNDKSHTNNLSNTDTSGDRIKKIYDQIPSPDLSKYMVNEKNYQFIKQSKASILSTTDKLSTLANDSEHQDMIKIDGIKSTLYPFQVKSVGLMLERECIKRRTIMPNFIKLESPLSSNFYFDLFTKRIYLHADVMSLPLGGILGENMGLGKTLMCLSLINLTKYEITKIPSDNFLLYNEIEIHDEIKTLTEICREKIIHSSIPWKLYNLPTSVTANLAKHPGYFCIDLNDHEKNKRSHKSGFLINRNGVDTCKRASRTTGTKSRSYLKLYMSSTTLIIVPDNLFIQWVDEIAHHVEPNFLKILCAANYIKSDQIKDQFLPNPKFVNTIPESPVELIEYDVILISQSCLNKSFANKNRNSQKNGNSQVPSLRQVYWKRLIIDEGHIVQSKTSNAAQICRLLFSERRWAVSGTPTSGLTKIYMEEGEEDTGEKRNSHQAQNNIHVLENQFFAKTELQRLGVLISNFLKLEPYYTQPKLWTQDIINPLINSRYGSELIFSNIINSIIIRHQPNQTNIKLPNFHHEKVILEPCFQDSLSFNLLAAVLAVNAVTSERTGIDYMFHQSNRQQLRRLLSNIQRATFYWTGFQQQDVETLVSICDEALLKSGKYNESDVELLRRSKNIALIALNNQRWTIAQLIHELGYYISKDETNQYVSSVWGISAYTPDVSVFAAPQLLRLQMFWKENWVSSFDNEQTFRDKFENTAKTFWDQYLHQEFKKNDRHVAMDKLIKKNSGAELYTLDNISKSFNDVTPPKRTIDKEAQAQSPPPKKKRKVTFTDAVIEEDERKQKEPPQSKDAYDNVSKDNKTIEKSDRSIPPFDMTGLFKNMNILGTSSAKLTYLATSLLENQRNRIKSIVFFEFEDSAYYLIELLEILKIRHIIYANFITPIKRAQNLYDFSNYDVDKEENNGGICLVMNIAHSSHGLNIIAATHIYFINPVKQESIEAQAIKRAHRIGQTKEVTVKTLYLKGVDELKILSRNEKLKNAKNDKESFDAKEKEDNDNLLEFLDFDNSEHEYAAFPHPISIFS